MTFMFELKGQIRSEVPHTINRENIALDSFFGVQKCPKYDFKTVRPTFRKTSKFKAHGHFKIVLFMTSAILKADTV